MVEVKAMMLESEIMKYWTEMWYERLMDPESEAVLIFPEMRASDT